MVIAGAVILVAAGWVAGMCTYRVSRRWCPRCGEGLTCATCIGRLEGRH